MTISQTINPEELTRRWLQKIVIGLNLCPFAQSAARHPSFRIAVSESLEPQEALADILLELDHLQQSSEAEIGTTLLVFTQCLQSFDDYLDVFDEANHLLVEAGCEGLVQLASFHPEYCFEGVEPNDVSHYTNRSPYPTVHFIREAQLSRLLSSYEEPEQIPVNNIRRLKELGLQGIQQYYAELTPPKM